MVKVAPLATVRLEVTLYGPPAAVHVVLAAIVPPAVVTLPLSYHTFTLVWANATPLVSRDWTSRRLMPGVRGTLAAVQVPCQATQEAGEPLTRTDRVSMALAVPERVTDGVVVWG